MSVSIREFLALVLDIKEERVNLSPLSFYLLRSCKRLQTMDNKLK